MKVYFYEFIDGKYFPYAKGIFVKEVEVIEKPKTFYPAKEKSYFPQSMCFVKKEDVGVLIGYNNNLIVFTEPNFEKAKSVFEENLRVKVEAAKKRLSDAEERLKILMDCEVAVDA